MVDQVISPASQAELIDLAYAAMMVRDLHSRIIFWNREAERLYGWSRDEALGQKSHELLHTRFPGPLAQIEAQVVATGYWQGEIVHLARDGHEVILLSRWALQRDTLGGPESILEVNLDVTEQKRAEAERADLFSQAAARAEAEEARQRFAFLAEASAMLAASLDYETTLSSVARLSVPHIADWCTVDIIVEDGSIQLLAIAHVDPEKGLWARELRRQYPPDLAGPAGLPHVLRAGEPAMYSYVTDEMLQAGARSAEHLAIMRAVGFASVMIVPLTMRSRTLGAITFVSAESGRHYGQADLDLAQNLARPAALAIDNARLYRQVQRLNESLERRAEGLEAANKELEAFAYSVSHDLRSPLRAIDGFSRILVEEFSDQLEEEAQHYLGLVRENAQQMGQLIDDLLALSRLGRQPLAKQPVEPRALVDRVLTGLADERAGRDVEIVVRDLPPCQGDAALLKQVYVNLLANALKFTRRCEHAHIEIGSLEKDGQTVYYVQDNGVGFDMQYADKLFGVFQRLHRAEDYEGTGAGLAIVQRIIHRHGGRLWVEARPDEGATFYFTL
jgi:PAS domain S-box-containing protein